MERKYEKMFRATHNNLRAQEGLTTMEAVNVLLEISKMADKDINNVKNKLDDVSFKLSIERTKRQDLTHIMLITMAIAVTITVVAFFT